jgi:Bacterial regulatory proteins, luxR family
LLSAGSAKGQPRYAGVHNEIAGELVVSVRTVEHHLQRVYEKLGGSGRKELALAFPGDEIGVRTAATITTLSGAKAFIM